MENYPQKDLLDIEELQVRYGTFWPRFWALLVDGLVLAILIPLVTYNKTEWKSMLLLVCSSLIQIAYKPFFEYEYGATPGKMALGLKVVNEEFQRASLQAIVLRNIFGITSGLIAFGMSIYAFTRPEFAQVSNLSEYGYLSDQTIAGLIIYAGMAIIFFVDLGFLLTSPQSRSLHDLIGKTFIIKK